MRIRTWPILAVVLCLGVGVPAGAQSRGLKTYKTRGDYCFDNPNAPTCGNGKPGGLTTPMKLPPIDGPIYRPPARQVAPSVGQTANATMVRLDEPDWRFAHPGADLLAGFNFSDLAQSKLVRSVLLKLAGGQSMAADRSTACSKTWETFSTSCCRCRAGTCWFCSKAGWSGPRRQWTAA